MQLLQEQIKAVIPSKTKQEWIDEEQRRRNGFANLQNHIAEMFLQRDSLLQEVVELEQQIAEAKEPFNRLSELRKKLDRVEEHHKQLKENLVSEKQRCSELLEREKIFYSAFFFSPTSDSPVQILQELEQLLDGTKKEMTEIDLGVLQDEKDQLDQNLIEIVAQLDDIKQKMQELEKQAPLVKSYVMDEVYNMMESGEAAIAAYYAGDYFTMVDAQAETVDLQFYYPEPTNYFVDAMCIPSCAKEKKKNRRSVGLLHACSTWLGGI